MSAHRRPSQRRPIRWPSVLACAGIAVLTLAAILGHSGTYNDRPRQLGHVTTPPVACVAAVCAPLSWPTPTLSAVR